MILKQYFLLPSYLLETEKVEFYWGIWDCNTFVSRWIDRLHDAKSSDEILGKYSTALSAARFYKKYITYDEYLSRWGYVKTNDTWKTGDIVIEPHKTWASAHIVCGDHLYSMHPERDLIKVPLHKLVQEDFEIWRL